MPSDVNVRAVSWKRMVKLQKDAENSTVQFRFGRKRRSMAPRGRAALHGKGRWARPRLAPQTNMDKLQKAGAARLMQQGNDRKEQLWFTG